MGKMFLKNGDNVSVINLKKVSEVTRDYLVFKGGSIAQVTQDQADGIVANENADLIMADGEVLNEVVKQSLNQTEGTYTIACCSDSCTYNTDSVVKNATYPVTFYSNEVGRGFYVGAKSTTEPQVGDWWCNCIKIAESGTATRPFTNAIWSNYVLCRFDYLLCYEIDNSKFINDTYINNISASYRKTANGKKDTIYGGLRESVKLFSRVYPSDSAYLFFAASMSKAEGLSKTAQFSLSQITASDLLAYQNVGVMGALFLSDSLGTSVTADSKKYASLSPILVDGAEVAYKRVGNLYLTSSSVTGAVTSDSDLYEVLQDNTDLIGSSAISLASNEEGGEV